MSVYDIAMIILFAGAIWFGYWKGLAWQIASVASIALSYFVAVTFPDAVSPYISAEAPYNRFAAMLILFIGTSLIVWTIFASVSKSLKKMELKGFDRQAGAILGAFKGAVLCMVVTMFAVSLLGERARDTIHQSKTGYYVVRGIDQLQGIAPSELAQFIHPYIENFRENIVDEEGNYPPRNPILENNENPQQVNQNQSQYPPNGYQNDTFPNQQFPESGQWSVPASQAGYQSQTPSNYSPAPTGSYQSGTFGNTNQNAPNNGSYQQGTFGNGGQNQTPWNGGNSYQPNNGNQPINGYLQPQNQWQPPAQPNNNSLPQNGWNTQFPTITQGENGWPDVEFKVNSQELIKRGTDAAIDAGKQWLENQRR